MLSEKNLVLSVFSSDLNVTLSIDVGRCLYKRVLDQLSV